MHYEVLKSVQTSPYFPFFAAVAEVNSVLYAQKIIYPLLLNNGVSFATQKIQEKFNLDMKRAAMLNAISSQFKNLPNLLNSPEFNRDFSLISKAITAAAITSSVILSLVINRIAGYFFKICIPFMQLVQAAALSALCMSVYSYLSYLAECRAIAAQNRKDILDAIPQSLQTFQSMLEPMKAELQKRDEDFFILTNAKKYWAEVLYPRFQTTFTKIERETSFRFQAEANKLALRIKEFQEDVTSNSLQEDATHSSLYKETEQLTTLFLTVGKISKNDVQEKERVKSELVKKLNAGFSEEMSQIAKALEDLNVIQTPSTKFSADALASEESWTESHQARLEQIQASYPGVSVDHQNYLLALQEFFYHMNRRVEILKQLDSPVPANFYQLYYYFIPNPSTLEQLTEEMKTNNYSQLTPSQRVNLFYKSVESLILLLTKGDKDKSEKISNIVQKILHSPLSKADALIMEITLNPTLRKSIKALMEQLHLLIASQPAGFNDELAILKFYQEEVNFVAEVKVKYLQRKETEADKQTILERVKAVEEKFKVFGYNLAMVSKWPGNQMQTPYVLLDEDSWRNIAARMTTIDEKKVCAFVDYAREAKSIRDIIKDRNKEQVSNSVNDRSQEQVPTQDKLQIILKDLGEKTKIYLKRAQEEEDKPKLGREIEAYVVSKDTELSKLLSKNEKDYSQFKSDAEAMRLVKCSEEEWGRYWNENNEEGKRGTLFTLNCLRVLNQLKQLARKLDPTLEEETKANEQQLPIRGFGFDASAVQAMVQGFMEVAKQEAEAKSRILEQLNHFLIAIQERKNQFTQNLNRCSKEVNEFYEEKCKELDTFCMTHFSCNWSAFCQQRTDEISLKDQGWQECKDQNAFNPLYKPTLLLIDCARELKAIHELIPVEVD